MSNANGLNVKKGTSTSTDPAVAAQELADAILQPGISFALFYCSPKYDLEQLGAELSKHFEGVELIGCTTAGEIAPIGYLDGALTGVSIASPDFTAATTRIDDLANFEMGRAVQAATEVTKKLGESDAGDVFGFLLIDGLSCQEEAVVSALYGALGRVDLFGGSAADGTDFGTTYIYHDGAFRSDAAVFTLIRTQRPFVVFKTEHFVSSDKKMVVTEADPARRIVSEINGEPAAQEYAEMVGLKIEELTPMVFATHPVVVRVGGEYFVRSIQKVNDDGSLTFFCAIDEGIVLTVAQGVDLTENLEGAFERVKAQVGEPELVLGCDCILRNLELEQREIKPQIAKIFSDNNVIGFATYGEQFNAMHVNQTFTGVAIGAARE